jgi:hypothetical protein
MQAEEICANSERASSRTVPAAEECEIDVKVHEPPRSSTSESMMEPLWRQDVRQKAGSEGTSVLLLQGQGPNSLDDD